MWVGDGWDTVLLYTGEGGGEPRGVPLPLAHQWTKLFIEYAYKRTDRIAITINYTKRLKLHAVQYVMGPEGRGHGEHKNLTYAHFLAFRNMILPPPSKEEIKEMRR